MTHGEMICSLFSGRVPLNFLFKTTSRTNKNWLTQSEVSAFSYTSHVLFRMCFSSKEGYGPGLIQNVHSTSGWNSEVFCFFPTYSNQDIISQPHNHFLGIFFVFSPCLSLGLTKKQKPTNVRLPSDDVPPPRFETSNLVTFNAFNKQGSGADGGVSGEDFAKTPRMV